MGRAGVVPCLFSGVTGDAKRMAYRQTKEINFPHTTLIVLYSGNTVLVRYRWVRKSRRMGSTAVLGQKRCKLGKFLPDSSFFAVYNNSGIEETLHSSV
jgi:hypothetical protein